MKTPYEYSESWFICATKVKNVIFLCAFYTNQKKRKLQQPLTEREKRFEYWGFKFEQFLLTGINHTRFYFYFYFLFMSILKISEYSYSHTLHS